ncbi:hypothetical protein V6N13_100363 [Hibiscus sabdariffa]
MEEEIEAGREVEVTSDEEGFKGVWYACIILKLPENKTKGKALVQYKTLLEEDNQTPLTENVELSFIRPLPPEPAFPGDHSFQVKELVDAFHLDGWWTGSVSQVLDNPRRYIVSFADPPDEIEFSSSYLRPHWKWVNGKWVKPSRFQGTNHPKIESMQEGVGLSKKYGRKLKCHVGGPKHPDAGDFPPVFENPRNDSREKSLELMVQSPLVGLAGDNESDESPNLPFVKTLQFWKVVESMDVFKAMPQSPHFHPLVESKKILREGLAVGHMLNFASLVEKTSKLKVADPENLFTTILDALPDFRNLGFDVEAVRDRTSELLLMKDRHEHLQHSSKDVELKLKQCSDELTKINEEIDVNSKMLRELKEKQASLLSKKTSNISQITSLQACVDVTTKDIQIVEAEFEGLARSTWSFYDQVVEANAPGCTNNKNPRYQVAITSRALGEYERR